MKVKSRQLLDFLIFLAVLVSLVLAVKGAFTNFSRVPYWDMWNGYLDFYVKSRTGDWHVWWAPHNEHRIVLARVLFWLDLRYLNGSQYLLIAFNYILASLAAVTFFRILESSRSESQNKGYVWGASAACTVWIFSWVQHENFTWGFQSQFFLAQLLPLVALYFLYVSSTSKATKGSWILACMFGILSVGTMANGVIILPLMLAYSVLTKQSRLRGLFLAIISVAAFYFYFHGMNSSGGSHSPALSLIEHPLLSLAYVLRYIGGPFYYFFGLSQLALAVAMIMASGLIIVSSVVALLSLRDIESNKVSLALLLFILYIGGTAIGTAGGRLIFGLDQALSSRYMTPAVMVWSAFFTLLTIRYFHKANVNGRSVFYKIIILVIVGISFPFQLLARVSHSEELFERDVAALALELGIQDQQQIGLIFPSAKAALNVSRVPVKEHMSIFADARIYNASALMGSVPHSVPVARCFGSLDSVVIVDEDPNFVKVAGWIFDSAKRATPSSSVVTNEAGEIVGFVLTGVTRHDVARIIDQNAIRSGFKGYVRRSELGKPVNFLANEPSCSLNVKIPRLLVSTKVQPVTVTPNLISGTEIIESAWQGKDSWHSVIPGLQVLGSWVGSDADTGSVTLRVKKTDTLYYRSGPTPGNQIIEILDGVHGKSVLPTSIEWSEMRFVDDSLPESFEVRLTDSGTGWGEWSAIAIKTGKAENDD